MIDSQLIEEQEFKSVKARKTILEWIKLGKLKPGDRLPSERTLSERLNVTKKTISKGLDELVSKGVIERRPRIGTFVKEVEASSHVALVLPDYMIDGDTYYGKQQIGSLFLAGASQALTPNDYLLTTVPYRPMRCWQDAGQRIAANDVRGVMLCTRIEIQKEEFEKYLESGIKVVLIGRHELASSLGLLSVDIDPVMAINQLLEKFFTLGHEHIVVFVYTDSPNKQLVEDAIKKKTAEFDREFSSDMIFEISSYDKQISSYDKQTGFSNLESVLNSENKPTALIAPDEFVASKLFQLCYSKGLRVPGDISLAAEWNSLGHPYPIPLTAPNSLYIAKRWAETAAKYLMRMLDGEQVDEREVNLRCDITWTNSIGSPSR